MQVQSTDPTKAQIKILSPKLDSREIAILPVNEQSLGNVQKSTTLTEIQNN
jgi:hypothetical protein